MAQQKVTAGEFSFASGSPFPTSLAQAVGKEMIALREQLERGAVAEDVLRYARANPESAIAQCFDWDRETAAEAHWLSTAGQLLRAIRVQIVVKDPRQAEPVAIETRLMQHVTPREPGLHEGKVYLTAMETLPNFHYRTQLIETALAEKDRWVNKYGYLHELDIFFRKLEEAEKDFGRKKRDR